MNRFAPGKLVAVALDSINPIRSRYCQGFFLAVKIYIDVDHNGQKIFKNIFRGRGLYIILLLRYYYSLVVLNHQPDSVSTSPQFFTSKKNKSTGPISG